MPDKRALMSCWNKEGSDSLARSLVEMGWEIVSTGGTAEYLRDADIPVTPVEEVTGFPSLLGGRVKTLHPALHAGILARRDRHTDMDELEAEAYGTIDLVAVNLYPFEEVTRDGADMDRALENIDIGGVTLLRAAAKNWPSVIVLCDPGDYESTVAQLQTGDPPEGTRRRLAARAFGHTARYDALIADHLAAPAELPVESAIAVKRRSILRYGENPHQRAALYSWLDGSGFDLGEYEQLGGPDLSFNNFLDVDAAVGVVAEFPETAVCAVKHTNPCGAALGGTPAEAFARTYEGDPVSIYGGVVALNRPVDEAVVDFIRGAKLFLEVIVAPDYTSEALEKLARRKKLRVLRLGAGAWSLRPGSRTGRFLRGGLLLSDSDCETTLPEDWDVVGSHHPEEAMCDAHFAWMVCKHTKSNAIVLAKDRALVGVGAGQMNRIASARLAVEAAGERARGAAMASDGFLPFPDVAELAAERGIAVLVQPGGSIRDDASAAVAEEAGMSLIFTGRRHFKH